MSILRSMRLKMANFLAPQGHSLVKNSPYKRPFRGGNGISLAMFAPTSYPYYGTAWKPSDWTADKAIQGGLKANPYVYACIEAYVNALSTVPHQIQRLVDGEWVADPNHPAWQVFYRPNWRMSRQDLLSCMIHDLFLTGNSLVSIIDSQTSTKPRTLELWPMPADNTTPIPDNLDFLCCYRVNRYASPIISLPDAPFPANENYAFVNPKNMIHIMFRDPSNCYWGFSPLQAAATGIDTDIAAASWNLTMLKQRGIAGGVLETPLELSKEQHAELKQLLKDEIGGMDHVYDPLLLSHGTTWSETSRTPVQMDYVDGRKLSREEVCAILRTPLPILGISEDATLANLSEYKEGFYLDSVAPLSEILCMGINLVWIHPRWGDKVRLAFDFSQIPALAKVMSQKIQDLQRLCSVGYPPNIAAKFLRINLPHVPELDQPRVSSNTIPAGSENDPVEMAKNQQEAAAASTDAGPGTQNGPQAERGVNGDAERGRGKRIEALVDDLRRSVKRLERGRE